MSWYSFRKWNISTKKKKELNDNTELKLGSLKSCKNKDFNIDNINDEDRDKFDKADECINNISKNCELIKTFDLVDTNGTEIKKVI